VKREEIVAGETYVTVTGEVLRVEDNTPGYSVKGGKWVHAPQTDRRYMGPVKGWQEYQSNVKIRATVVGVIDAQGEISEVSDRKIAIPPREISDTLDGYVEQFKRARKAQAKAERTTTQVKKALQRKGLKVVSIDADKGQVTLGLESVTEVLVNG
jgi:hypothetical protein